MKNFKSLLAAAVATVAIAGAASAQAPATGASTGDRAFSFTPNAATNSTPPSYSTQVNDFQDVSTATIGSGGELKTTINVSEFLFIRAKLGGQWQVDGWGDGLGATQPANQFLDVYHSDPVRLTGNGWGDPTFQGNANHAADSTRVIPMTFTNTLTDTNGNVIGSTPTPIAVNALNGPFDFAPDVNVGPTGPTLGHLRADYDFQIAPDETTYSGTYEMNPTLTFTNQ